MTPYPRLTRLLDTATLWAFALAFDFTISLLRLLRKRNMGAADER